MHENEFVVDRFLKKFHLTSFLLDTLVALTAKIRMWRYSSVAFEEF